MGCANFCYSFLIYTPLFCHKKNLQATEKGRSPAVKRSVGLWPFDYIKEIIGLHCLAEQVNDILFGSLAGIGEGVSVLEGIGYTIVQNFPGNIKRL